MAVTDRARPSTSNSASITDSGVLLNHQAAGLTRTTGCTLIRRQP